MFDILVEMMFKGLLASEEVELERGIVHDEYLLAAGSAGGQVGRALDHIYTVGTPYEGKHVVGDPDVIKSMTPETLREFYDAWYRPSNMALIAVGDISTEKLESLVHEHFGGMEGRGLEPRRDPIEVELRSETVVDSLAIPGVGASRLSLDFAATAWPVGTVGGEHRILMETVILKMLENRLIEEFNADRLTQATMPYLLEFFSGNALKFYGTNFGGDELAVGTTDLLSVLAGAAEFGFTQEEMDRAVEAVFVVLNAAVEAEPTLQDGDYAALYVKHFLEGAYIDSAEDRRDWYESQAEELTVDDMSEHWQWMYGNSAPIVVAYGETASSIPSADELADAVEAVKPRKKAPPEQPIDTLMAAPGPVKPVSFDTLDLFGEYSAHEWNFANGATVVFVESPIAEGSVDLQAQSLGGYSIGEPGDSGLRRLAIGAVGASGLGEASATQLGVYLDGSTASATPTISATAERIAGKASTGDLEDLFALLHLYHTQARISNAGLNNAKSNASDLLDYAASYGPYVTYIAYFEARHPDNPWYRILTTQEQIDTATAESLLTMYGKRFGGVDDLLVVVVGDADSDTVADLAARYVGNLPADVSDTYTDRRSPHPEGVTRIEVPLVDPTGTSVSVHYDSPVEFTPKLAVTVDVLQEVLDERIFLKVREELGTTYQAGASLNIIMAPEVTVESEFSSTGEEQFLDKIYERIIDAVEDMVANGPSESDLAQAKEIVADDYAVVQNSHLIDVALMRHYLNDDDIPTPARRIDALKGVTAADVQMLAEQLYGSGQRIEVFGVVAGSEDTDENDAGSEDTDENDAGSEDTES